MNLTYLVTSQLINSKGLYNRNIYTKIIPIKKYIYANMFAIMPCLSIFHIKLIYCKCCFYSGLIGNLKLACLSTVNKRINAIYYINFRKNNLCSEIPTTINKKEVSTFNVTKL